MSNKLHHGDCLEVMPTLDADSVDAIISDPPYGLSFMGKAWDHGVPGEVFWREALRVAKPGAHLLAFGGTRTFHRLTVAIEDAGWEIRDCVMWVYGSGFPKSHNGEWGGTALKPAWEPIIVARKPLIGTVAANVLVHGTGGMNIDACRVDGEPTSGSGANMSNDVYGKYQDIKVGKPNVVSNQGRFPANLIHDGSDEVVAAFPQTTSPAQYEKKKAGWLTPGSTHPANDLQSREYGDTGSAARFFYCAKASKADRNEGLDEFEDKENAHSTYGIHSDEGLIHNNRNPENRTRAQKNHHPTVKPTALMRYLCKLVTRLGGTVLDPFCGSGSTGKAAILEGFKFIGIEKDAEYFSIAEARINFASLNSGTALEIGHSQNELESPSDQLSLFR